MKAFKRISDFEGTSDKGEFQSYVVMLIIVSWILSRGSLGPIESLLRLAGLIWVELPLPALMIRRLRDLGRLPMGKVWLSTALLFLVLSIGVVTCVSCFDFKEAYSIWLAIPVLIYLLSFFVVVGLGVAIFLFGFFESAKVKEDKTES